MTISNLQAALVDVKLKLEDHQQKTSQEVSGWSRWFGFSDATTKHVNNNQNNNSDSNVHDI